MKRDFKDISYLELGNPRQRQAYKVLKDSRILDKLGEFDPILVGTVPIGIDVDGSDLDIVCCYDSAERFMACLNDSFSNYADYRYESTCDQNVITVNFFVDDFEIEIYGQPMPSERQNGYLHMVVEWEILQRSSPQFREEIINLKKTDIKTEPAFAKLLGLEGDPYISLLEYGREKGYI